MTRRELNALRMAAESRSGRLFVWEPGAIVTVRSLAALGFGSIRQLPERARLTLEFTPSPAGLARVVAGA